MTRTCPTCGSRAIDDQSQFCNKCGTPFPADEQPTKIFVRTTPRPNVVNTTLPTPPQPVQPPVEVPEPEYYSLPPNRQAPAATPGRIPAGPSRERQVRRPLVPRQPVKETPLPFTRVIARDSPKLVYWLGVIAILLVVFAGITSELSKTTKTPGSSSGDSADNTAKTSGDLLASVPLFWIGIFLIANLGWRVLCETSALTLVRSGGTVVSPAEDSGETGLAGDERSYSEDTTQKGDTVECPRCGRIVAPADLRTCETCDARGCTNCIRLMGLFKKKWTCRDCFER